MPTPSGFLPPATTGADAPATRAAALASIAKRVVTRMIALLMPARVRARLLAAASQRIILQEMIETEEVPITASSRPVACAPPLGPESAFKVGQNTLMRTIRQ